MGVTGSGRRVGGTDKLNYLHQKSGSLEREKLRYRVESGARRHFIGDSNPLRVAPAHDLDLTCQYRAPHYRDLRISAFAEWSRAVA